MGCSCILGFLKEPKENDTRAPGGKTPEVKVRVSTLLTLLIEPEAPGSGSENNTSVPLGTAKPDAPERVTITLPLEGIVDLGMNEIRTLMSFARAMTLLRVSEGGG